MLHHPRVSLLDPGVKGQAGEQRVDEGGEVHV